MVECRYCGEEHEDEEGEMSGLIAAQNDPEIPVSFFGLPMNWDGAWPTEACIYIDRIENLNAASWQYLSRTRQVNWVIIPLESQKHGNHADPDRGHGPDGEPEAQVPDLPS